MSDTNALRPRTMLAPRGPGREIGFSAANRSRWVRLLDLAAWLCCQAVIRQLAADGWTITPTALTALSPYITERIKRFGEYATDGLTDPPAAFDPRLELPQHVASRPATANMAA